MKNQGSREVPSSSLGQVDFLSGQVTLKAESLAKWVKDLSKSSSKYIVN